MFAANAYSIRQAADSEATALRELSELDSRRAPAGTILFGEIDGRVVAALSVEHGDVVADPFARTAQLVAMMRLRANALRAHRATPSVRDRLRAGIRVRQAAPSPTAA